MRLKRSLMEHKESNFQEQGDPIRSRCFEIKPFLQDAATVTPHYTTDLGALFAGDCLSILPLLKDAVIDTVFADPPFNLGKKYGKSTNDRKSDEHYLDWCKRWL